MIILRQDRTRQESHLKTFSYKCWCSYVERRRWTTGVSHVSPTCEPPHECQAGYSSQKSKSINQIKLKCLLSSLPPPIGWAWKEMKLMKNPVFLLMSLTSDTTSEYEMSEFSTVASLLKKNHVIISNLRNFCFLLLLPPSYPLREK